MRRSSLLVLVGLFLSNANSAITDPVSITVAISLTATTKLSQSDLSNVNIASVTALNIAGANPAYTVSSLHDTVITSRCEAFI